MRVLAYLYLYVGICLATWWIIFEMIVIQAKRRDGVDPRVRLVLCIAAVPIVAVCWPGFVAMCVRSVLAARIAALLPPKTP